MNAVEIAHWRSRADEVGYLECLEAYALLDALEQAGADLASEQLYASQARQRIQELVAQRDAAIAIRVEAVARIKELEREVKMRTHERNYAMKESELIAENFKALRARLDVAAEALREARQRIYDCKHNAFFSSKDAIVKHVAELLPRIDAAFAKIAKGETEKS